MRTSGTRRTPRVRQALTTMRRTVLGAEVALRRRRRKSTTRSAHHRSIATVPPIQMFVGSVGTRVIAFRTPTKASSHSREPRITFSTTIAQKLGSADLLGLDSITTAASVGSLPAARRDRIGGGGSFAKRLAPTATRSGCHSYAAGQNGPTVVALRSTMGSAGQ